MYDLAETYKFQYGTDKFLLEIVDGALNYYSTCIPLCQLKHNCCMELVKWERAKTMRDTAFINKNIALCKAAQVKLDELGYKDEPPEVYKAFVKGMEDEKKKRGGLVKSN